MHFEPLIPDLTKTKIFSKFLTKVLKIAKFFKTDFQKFGFGFWCLHYVQKKHITFTDKIYS